MVERFLCRSGVRAHVARLLAAAPSLRVSWLAGLILTLTGCVRGYYTTGGAEGVGRATTHAVVSASLIILLVDFFLTKILF